MIECWILFVFRLFLCVSILGLVDVEYILAPNVGEKPKNRLVVAVLDRQNHNHLYLTHRKYSDK